MNKYMHYKILIFSLFCFYFIYQSSSEDIKILSEKELYEIAETVSFVYFQQFDLEHISLPFYSNYKMSKEEIPKFNKEIMTKYRNILFKNKGNYTYDIDTFRYPIMNNVGLMLFNSYYHLKKFDDYEILCSKHYKMAINQYGKCYKLFGFDDNSNDFEMLYMTYLTSLNSTYEVFDVINFYVFNVLYSIGDSKVILIDSTNKRKYSKYYPEITLPSIIKNEGVWTASFSVLVYSEYFDSVELYEYIFFLNEKDRKFSYKENLIKKYYIERP